MKILLIVIDGLGDEPIPELGNKTPLEAADTANLDFLAQNGICGLVEPFKFEWQDSPKSDTCHLALLGYEPQKYYLGRGVYEAAGIGVELKRGDIALRANFATIDENLKVTDRRAGRIEATRPLVDSLRELEVEGVKFLLFKSYGHRAVLVLRGSNLSRTFLGKKVRDLSAEISDSDPKKEGLEIKKVVAKDNLPEDIFTAKILNKYLLEVYQILKNHPLNIERVKKDQLPANCILTRGAGKFKKTISFKEKYGLDSACIAGGGLYKGIAKILGMDIIEVKGANGLKDTNLKGKILATKRALKKYDFVFLHIKAADSLAEDGNFLGKKEFIERLDKNLKSLLNLENTLIVITGDHSTCSRLKSHCSRPVPLLIFGPGIKSYRTEKFGEGDCKKGGLGQFSQLDSMSKILNFAKI